MKKKELRRLLWLILNRLRVEMAYLYMPAKMINPISKICNRLRREENGSESE